MIVPADRKLRLLERLEILRCLYGCALECGCVVGWYETYAGHVLVVVDETAHDCPEGSHRVSRVIQEHRHARPMPRLAVG